MSWPDLIRSIGTERVDFLDIVTDWSKYQLDGYFVLPPPAKRSGSWDEFGECHLVVLNPIYKDGRMWVLHEADIKAMCPTRGAAEAALRLLLL
jgi:hypothetical protein